MISSRDARSCASISALYVLPPALSLVRAICISPHHWFVVFFLLILRRRNPRAGYDTRMPAEFGNDGIADGNAHVIDAGAAAAGDLPRGGNQTIAELARLDKGDLALGCDHALIVRVAGESEGG